MSIQQSELVWRKSLTNDNTTSNGGLMTSTVVSDAVKNNLWPDVSQAERTSGSTTYRKMHLHVANDADLQLINARVFVERFTPGDDAVTIFLGDETDTQATVTGSEQQYGCGQLNADISASATSLTVLAESDDGGLDYFKDGMLIRVSDMTDVDDATGNQEYVTISGAPSYAGDVATINFTPALANAYVGVDTRVASVIEAGTIEATATTPVVTSGAGTFDDTYLTMDGIGTVEEDWTLTFSDATNYTIVGTTLGSQGSGTTSGASPSNADYSKPYFVITAAAFGGTYTNGNTITFTTSPAAIPVWCRRTIPAAAASLTANSAVVAVDGESA